MVDSDRSELPLVTRIGVDIFTSQPDIRRLFRGFALAALICVIM